MTDDVDWTAAMPEALARADTLEKGSYFEDFTEGETVEHAPGLRLTRDGNDLWTSQTLNHDPAYWRPDAARDRGFDEPPIHPDYLVACTMGPSVEDLSEKGGYFLGRTDVRFHREAVSPGTDLRVESRVLDKRTSSSRPAYGIVSWETTSYDVATDEPLCSYTRTNMVPRREPGDAVATDGGETATSPTPSLPIDLVAPSGPYFEDFREALEGVEGRDAAVAYRHERGRTVDDVLMSVLPLRTLNTAGQHHNAEMMADSPSGEMVVYGDVTRSIALGHARSDEATWREVCYEDERFHDFVTTGDTVFAFTRVVDADAEAGDVSVASDEASGADTGRVTFEHYAVAGDDRVVYSGTRTARIRRRED
ncbi:L-erythro-3-methylmalyl-CoA dehydratase [Halogranum gelatinilyticum]|uniref:L-erythro-3-methylmalyl-CoA dehydratase n=1 Tax=Halogranum gelatinilyticum TaxID=660521 RepID=A0A1G9T5C6_9EURY|nr:2-methylfumaryl-CoA hydratase [Halogranum gelatinilyticum]SDM42923.1 L-erythro-3-methylmalyl-CoA dehydratase [Halogranum gelatinilyticum]